MTIVMPAHATGCPPAAARGPAPIPELHQPGMTMGLYGFGARGSGPGLAAFALLGRELKSDITMIQY
jgi:hypothetical protein